MSYSEKLIDHYENPRNIGKLDKEDIQVGTGLVGAPACGDVMKLQIKVGPEGLIEDAKFKTFGCLASNTSVNTPTKSTKMSDLKIGDEVYAWNGISIVKNKITNIIKKEVPINELLKITFSRKSKGKNQGNFSIICTKDHIFWNSNNTPIEAEELIIGQELYEMTEYELRKLNNVRHTKWLKTKNSKRMKEFNKIFDHSKLPQNQLGYVCKNTELRSKRASEASIRNWSNPEYIKNWTRGMESIDRSVPTNIELKYINCISDLFY